MANLRGEVGEIIFSWILYHYLRAQAAPLRTDDQTEITRNSFLFFLDALMEKLEDEIAARLSELAQDKVGRLNFHFASRKLGILQPEVKAYSLLIEQSRMKEKRDRYISHKDLPETWQEHKDLHIQYPVLVKGIAAALRLMKKFDREYVGPAADALWREMRSKRYDFSMPPRMGYMLLPYIRLDPDELRTIYPDPDG
jgi:hypothetical protein